MTNEPALGMLDSFMRRQFELHTNCRVVASFVNRAVRGSVAGGGGAMVVGLSYVAQARGRGM